MSHIFEYCKTYLNESDYIFITTFFQNCPASNLAKMEIVEFEKNQLIMETGSENTYFYVLLKGIVSVVDEKVPSIPFAFSEFRAVEFLGDYELFSNAPNRFVSLRAKTKCVCIRIQTVDYMDWLKTDINALFIRTNMLMNVLNRESQFMRQFVFLSVEMRLIVYFCEEYQKTELSEKLRITATREEIASKVACSIRTLNRMLLKMEKNQLISRQHGKIFMNKQQFKAMEKILIKNNVSIYY